MKLFKQFLATRFQLLWLKVKFYFLFKKYSKYTMIPRNVFYTNLKLAFEYKYIPGDIVECGVWKGGMVAGISELVKTKKAFLFDSYEGLPEAKEIDGKGALIWQKDTRGSYYFDNCTAEEKYAIEAMKQTGCNYESHKGWFEFTLKNTSSISCISILRLDADWYESTLVCLEYLYPKLSKGGIVIIDDYYTWDGCSRAVHFYLNSINSISKIKSKDGVAYIKKMD